MHKWHQARKFVHHWLHEINEHSLHEPFVFDIYSNVVIPARHARFDQEIELRRAQYKSRKQPLGIQSPGAPSAFQKRSLYQTAFLGSTAPQHASILARLARYSNATSVLELGTSLGFTSMYLGRDPGVNLFTLEGDPVLSKEANKNLAGYENIAVIDGNIDETLPEVLVQMQTADFVYFDANHRYEPTLNYFELVLPYCHEQSVLVFDDIHWSSEMSSAWNEISKHPRVSVSMDFYHMGWVFLKPLERKYHYILSLN